MKRKALIAELEQAGCQLLRSSGKHDVYVNPILNRRASIPRHNEIKESLCHLIRKQLGVRED